MNWNELKSQSIDAIVRWFESTQWADSMTECQQDTKWHAEGDVWTHTQLVVQQLPELPGWEKLTVHQKTVLVFTALFHDVAKPYTTKVDSETGNIISPKHAVQGEHVARRILRELGCDLLVREEIARMVRFHGRPVFLTERGSPAQEVVKMSWLLQNQLLYLFSLADSFGRINKEHSRPPENLEFWKLLSQEHDCFKSRFKFASPHARFCNFQKQDSNDSDLFYVPYEDFRCTVTMMCGLPGSGKDTWVSRIKPDGFPVVSLDGIRRELGVAPTENQGVVAQAAIEACKNLLRNRTSFVFNATNTLRLTRTRWIRLFKDYNAKIEIVYVEPDWHTLLKQNKERESHVPLRVLEKLANKFEPPTLLEAHQVYYFDGEETHDL